MRGRERDPVLNREEALCLDRSRSPRQSLSLSLLSLLFQVRPGSVQGAPRASSVGPRVGNTFSRVPDPEATRGAHFSGDETDKDFQFQSKCDTK